MTHSLSEWFMQTYGDWNYQHQDFVMPVKESEKKTDKIIIYSKAQEEEKEEELTKAAIASAERAELVDKKVRLKQANKMASQRQKSEAETRYMIDEQLRQVGWEANTQEIRYAKGARPAKGRNMAIAEWPTDSTVSKKGYADYALFVGMILSRLVDTFISRISLTMLPVPNPHNTVCVLSWEEARHWQSRSSGYSSS